MSRGVGRGVFTAAASLPEGSYYITVWGTKLGCGALENILVLAGHDRSVTLVPQERKGKLIPLTAPYQKIYQLGGSLPLTVRGVTASCTNDDGLAQNFAADIDGSAYYFDYINAWRCSISVWLWGTKTAIALNGAVDLTSLAKSEGFIRKDISLAEITRAAGL